MMLTNRQKKYLRGLAHDLKPATQIGKDGITESFINQLNDILNSRELVKVSVLQTSPVKTKEAVKEVIQQTESEYVHSIGRKFTIYRKSEEKVVVKFPAEEER
jgi:RNA-binding protein